MFSSSSHINTLGVQGERLHVPTSLLSDFRKWSYFFLRVDFVDHQTLLNLPIVPVALLSPMPSATVSAVLSTTYPIHFAHRHL